MGHLLFNLKIFLFRKNLEKILTNKICPIMKCYNHPENDAIGICKNCNKGLCKECLTEVENGIACTSTCIDEVKLINSLINRNKQSYKVTSGAHYKNAYLFGGIGIVMIFYGIITESLTGFLVAMGIIFLIGSIFSIISANKYKKAN
jgi:hypothetical protein